MQTNTVMTAMNQLSNHDHSRFLPRTNQMVGRTGTMGPDRAGENIKLCVLREAVVIQMTWPGAPTLYYGDEAGVCGWTDPDSRRTYPWGKEDQELIPAITAHKTIFSTDFRKNISHFDQNEIAHIMSVRIIIVFEIVQVNKHHSQLWFSFFPCDLFQKCV